MTRAEILPLAALLHEFPAHLARVKNCSSLVAAAVVQPARDRSTITARG